MDIGRAFRYVFDDEQWLAVILIGGLLMIVPIFGQIVLIGFMLEAARNVAMGSPQPLPRWNNLGEKFTQGLYGLIIQIVYSLPAILLSCVFACLILASTGVASRNEGAAAAIILPLVFCFIPLMILISLVVQPVILAALARYLQTGSLSASLRVGEVITMVRGNLSTWVVLWLLQILCGFVANLGAAVVGIGVLFTAVYALAVFGHLLGQTLAQSTLSNSYTPPSAL